MLTIKGFKVSLIDNINHSRVETPTVLDSLKDGEATHLDSHQREQGVSAAPSLSGRCCCLYPFNIAGWRGFVKRQLPFLTLSSGSAPIVGLLWKG